MSSWLPVSNFSQWKPKMIFQSYWAQRKLPRIFKGHYERIPNELVLKQCKQIGCDIQGCHYNSYIYICLLFQRARCCSPQIKIIKMACRGGRSCGKEKHVQLVLQSSICRPLCTHLAKDCIRTAFRLHLELHVSLHMQLHMQWQMQQMQRFEITYLIFIKSIPIKPSHKL